MFNFPSKLRLPTHVDIEDEKQPFIYKMVIMTEMIKTIEKKRFREKLYSLDNDLMMKVDAALKRGLGLYDDAC